MQKGQAQVLILAGIVLLIAVAGGIFYLGRITVPKPQNVATSSPQPSPQTVYTESDRSANWKTYTNIKNGFQFKYPSIFTLEESSQSNISLVNKSKNLAVKGNPPIYPSVSISIETNNLPTEKYIKNKSLFAGEKILIGKNEFLTAYSEAGGAPLLYLIKKGSTIITFGEINEPGDKTYLDQILSTFKFTQ